jgi:hypothetical protein
MPADATAAEGRFCDAQKTAKATAAEGRFADIQSRPLQRRPNAAVMMLT